MLTPEDLQHLAEYEAKAQLVRDRVAGVATLQHTGLYLWGQGGCGKTYTVLQELEQRGTNYRVANSRLTGKGLIELLDEARDVVHVLEDMEQLFDDRNALGVLRSALGGKGGEERMVTWRSSQTKIEVPFCGGIILVGNRPLDDGPEAVAIKTRIDPLRFQPTNAELAALMRNVASRGYPAENPELSPGACMEVVEYIIDRSLSTNRNLNMRLLDNGLRDRIQCELGDSETTWQGLVESRLSERANPENNNQRRESRDQCKQREQGIIRELLRQTGNLDERLRLWKQKTNKGRRAYYRRLAEVLPPNVVTE